MQRSVIIALAVAFTSAAGSALAASAAPVPPSPTQLPRGIQPLHYDVSVVPHAAELRFEGRVVVTILVRTPTRRIILNAAGLTFDGVRLAGGAPGSRALAPVAIAPDALGGTVTFGFVRRIRPGLYRLTLEYHAAIGTQPEGLFAIDYGAGAGTRRAIFTQFEPASARRFMPSWDEPAYKATFTLDAIVPAAQTAVSNMPMIASEPLGGGLRRVRFAATPRMSTYLLFLGVGDFERVTTHAGATEVGVVMRKGAAEQAGFALDSTASILRDYDDYFAVPYPLPKLDNVASPGESGFFGAMENWGAIYTFEKHLLFDPSIGTQFDRQRIFAYAAHEIAHQWFGNLVTMRWWDDLWLNESFASWMARRETQQRHPEWNTELTSVRRRNEAMELDAFRTAHPIVSKVDTVDQISQSFDAITYAKGAALIRMVEAYVGADIWREGVRRYLKAHAYANTRTDDLWQAIEAAAGKPIGDVTSDFTNQPGVPMLRVGAASCNDGKTTLSIEQGEFSNDRPGKAALRWRVPVIARIPGSAPAAALVDGKAELVLQGCGPVVVNAGQTGYFRTWYAPAQRSALCDAFTALDAIDQLGVMDDLWALALAGQVPMSDALELVSRTPVEADPTLWGSIAERLGTVDSLYRDDRARQAPWRNYAIARLAPVLARVGWRQRTDEPPPVTVLRTELIETLGGLGDETTIAEARRRYTGRESDPTAYPPALRKVILAVVARHADAATWDALRAAARTEPSPVLKDSMYHFLASARDETLAQRALDIAISDEPSATVASAMVSDVAEEHPELAFGFALAHFERLNVRLSDSVRPRFYPGLATTSNDPGMVDRIDRFATASIPPWSRQSAHAAMAQVGFRADVVRERLPEVDAWLRTRP
jgi:aminopeptidase N